MIFDWLVGAPLFVLNTLMSYLPNIDTNNLIEISNAYTSFRGQLAWANFMFPVDTFLIVFGFVIFTEFNILTLRLIHWIMRNLTIGLIK